MQRVGIPETHSHCSLHFWAMRSCGVFERSPSFAEYYIKFIGHFVSVYERTAPAFARDSGHLAVVLCVRTPAYVSAGPISLMCACACTLARVHVRCNVCAHACTHAVTAAVGWRTARWSADEANIKAYLDNGRVMKVPQLCLSSSRPPVTPLSSLHATNARASVSVRMRKFPSPLTSPLPPPAFPPAGLL